MIDIGTQARWAFSLKHERRASGQRSNIENLEHTLGVVFGFADVTLGGAKGGDVREAAAGPRDRLRVVAVVGGIDATENGEQVG